ncbi:MAG: hypothetical protein NQ127_03275 [Candidatus Cardinium sp.]|nr:hypothetical protein [Candidatus Cardinium sp.]
MIRVPGTPLEHMDDVDPFDFVRTIAIAKVMIPKSYIRLSAGREKMSDVLQTLCFLAGASSIFYGEKLLTVKNPLPISHHRVLYPICIAFLFIFFSLGCWLILMKQGLHFLCSSTYMVSMTRPDKHNWSFYLGVSILAI